MGEDQELMNKLNDLENYMQQKGTGDLPPQQFTQTARTNEFNLLANPSGNRMLDDMERVFKLRQDVDRCEDLESEEKAMVNLAS